MKPNPTPTPNPEELLTRWIDGALSPAELAKVESELSGRPEWLADKQAAEEIRQLLRSELPARQEPASAEFFTSQIMQQITRETAAAPRREESGGLLRWLKSAWAAPLATAAALLVAGLFVLRQVPQRESFATPYTPDPNVRATLTFDDSAEATVINLEGLESIPDEREIKAFAVSSAEPAGPGEPQRFYAASDPKRLVFVLFPGADVGPAIQEVH